MMIFEQRIDLVQILHEVKVVHYETRKMKNQIQIKKNLKIPSIRLENRTRFLEVDM